ncbi:BnaC06g00330D [Brassica napus]|uniref:BnaC06g00330D protein n=1 Tax=Brassica napus TaxID=3708 RepID=A0A078FRJ5_BRANA|nr:BnaC06g00330D [Brassica napus]
MWHMLAVGSMVPKVTSVRHFRLNSSLYVSGPMARAGAPRSFFLCGTMPGREGNASRRRTTTRQLHFGFSLHEMSPVHWTDG